MQDAEYPKVYLYRRIVQGKLFIDAHFSDPINLDNISDEAFLSKFHFIRLFKKAYGKTPHQYLTYVRIERAKHLLRGDRLVSDVCADVGFDSVGSFTTLFKKSTGMTPSAYQQRQLTLREEITSTPLKFVPNCFAEKHGWLVEAFQ
ncbi:MAG TPA: AraC family transcriptional regulator [Cyclobacteriaceae bacterium]|nr:AraC family transcriptional regulator [Cyclobacteriaceae bacterium]